MQHKFNNTQIIQLKSTKKNRGWRLFPNWGWKGGDGDGISPKAGKRGWGRGEH